MTPKRLSPNTAFFTPLPRIKHGRLRPITLFNSLTPAQVYLLSTYRSYMSYRSYSCLSRRSQFSKSSMAQS